jgi:hypothetical protein
MIDVVKSPAERRDGDREGRSVRLCEGRMLFVRAYPRETQEMVFDSMVRCDHGMSEAGSEASALGSMRHGGA